MGRGTTKWWRGYSGVFMTKNDWHDNPLRLRRTPPFWGRTNPPRRFAPPRPRRGIPTNSDGVSQKSKTNTWHTIRQKFCGSSRKLRLLRMTLVFNRVLVPSIRKKLYVIPRERTRPWESI